MRKLLFTLTCLIGSMFVSCGGGNSSELVQLREENRQLREENRQLIEQLKGTVKYNTDSISADIETNEIEDPDTSTDPYGEYEFTDAIGTKWKVIFNNDETAIVEGKGQKHYASVDEIDNNAYKLNINHNEPTIIFPLRNTCKTCDSMFLVLDLDNDYIYASNEFRAKNPDKRLKIEKIK